MAIGGGTEAVGLDTGGGDVTESGEGCPVADKLGTIGAGTVGTGEGIVATGSGGRATKVGKLADSVRYLAQALAVSRLVNPLTRVTMSLR